MAEGAGGGCWGPALNNPPPPQGDGNIRYYEVSADKPHLNYLTEYRSYHPQKGIGECGAPRPRGTWGDRDEPGSGPAWRGPHSGRELVGEQPGSGELWLGVQEVLWAAAS